MQAAKLFDDDLDLTTRNSAAILLRRVVYAQALEWARALRPDMPEGVNLTGYNSATKIAHTKQWMPHLDKEGAPDDMRSVYQELARDKFVTYRRVRQYAVLDTHPYDWEPHKFELALWRQGKLLALSNGSINEERDAAGHMGVGVVVNAPGEANPLCGFITPLVHCAALAWAHATRKTEVHYLGGFTEAGEAMMARLQNRYGFVAEKRGDGQYSDTMRFSTAKGLARLGV